MLSDLKIRALKPKEKSYTIRDGRGLYLEVTPKDSKLWRIRIWQNGREIKRSLGRYPDPDVSLREARLKRDEILLARDKGVNILASSNKLETFQEIALDWYSRKMEGVRSDSHAVRVLSRLKRYVFPAIGHKHINEIKPPEILAFLRQIENAGKIETAHRVLQVTSQVNSYRSWRK